MGGGASMQASERSRRPPPSTNTIPTQDTADSEAAACDRRWCRRRSRPGVQAAEFDPRSPSWSPRIYGPGVQAEAMHIQNGCRTHPGGLSVRARVGDRSMPWSSWRACTADNCMPVMCEHTHRESRSVDRLAAQSMVRHHHCVLVNTPPTQHLCHSLTATDSC